MAALHPDHLRKDIARTEMDLDYLRHKQMTTWRRDAIRLAEAKLTRLRMQLREALS